MIPITNIFPPSPNTISEPNITANRFANSTPMLARRMRDLASYRYIGGLLLPNRVTTTSGSINYEVTGEGITADDAPAQVAPGAEYQLTQAGDGTSATAAVGKWGQDTILTDEGVSRLQGQYIDKKLTKLTNSAKILIDTAVVSAVNASISSNTQAVSSGAWSVSGTAKILLDVAKAQSAIRATGLGYEGNILLIADEVAPFLMSDSLILAAMAREDKSNPVYTGKFPVLAGLEVMTVPSANLPGGLTTAAFVLDRGALGFILTENIGSEGYVSAGDLVEVRSWRPDDTDGRRLRARSIFKAVITDPLAAQRITGVL